MTLRPSTQLGGAPAAGGPHAPGPPESDGGVTTSAPATPDRPAPRARVAGVFRSPKRTFEALVAAPRWADVLVLAFVVTALCSAALLQTEVGRLALVDQWERTATAFGRGVDDAEYAALQAASENGLAYAVLTALASGPLLAVGVSALIFAVFTGALRGGAGFRPVLAVVAHAQLILALRQVVATPFNYARETLASPTTAGLLFGMLDEASLPARFLAMLDLFVLWWIVVLAVGTSVLYRRSARTLAFTFFGGYVALALLLAIVMAVTGGTA